MNFTAELDRYLSQFRHRLKQLAVARGMAVLAIAALLITVIAVGIAIRNGFPTDIVVASRIILIVTLGGIAYWLIVRPSRQLEADGARNIEECAPLFEGRVETYAGMRDTSNPMRDLLAENALQIAHQQLPENRVPARKFKAAIATASVAIIGLLFLAINGPGNYAYGVRHLWLGWAMPGLLPPQSIDVSPGDDGIRLGGNVNIDALMQGFEPGEAFVHAKFGDGEWQQVPMTESEDSFEFTFFSVRESVEYFVSAANTRSPTFNISVVDLPVIENLVVTYRYPDWTGREVEIENPGGDVRAIAETNIEVQIQTDRPMSPGELVLDDRAIDMEVIDNRATASFTVSQDGQYFVAASVGGEQIRLTDDYFVTLLEDEAPEIEFARPGRDWSASSVEEVTASVLAVDDYRVEKLELRYSVNGGAWQSIAIPADPDNEPVDHVFFLESMARDEFGGALEPGDLIAYYGVAEDRENTARTDIFFIDVQPFDRRYSQSQQAGGGGQQGGQQQDEISQRQREIIVSTWNLIREQQEKRRNDPAYVSDNAALLSRVQATLREQVQTLSQRTQARQLTASAEEIARFVENLDKAAAAMVPASERLGEIELEQAILPEQEALQHLLAAEAVFTDISVSLQANNRGGGGGQAGRDLTEMFELEMDLEKNQYETGSTASPDAPQEQLQEAADELEELARRQEQLANNANSTRQPTPAQRWQQEMLRRDVEELRERLERMQQASAANQSQPQNGQQQDSGQSSNGSPSGQPSEGQQSGGSASQQSDELQRRLDSAIRAMNEADEAMRNGASPDEMRRAAEEAQRQLEGARNRALDEQQRAMQATLDELGERAEALYENQSAMDDRIQESIRDVSVGTNDLDRLDSGMTIDEEYALAAEKRQLQADMQALEQDARTTASRIEDLEPDAAEEILDALKKLREDEIEARIARAAAYIEKGAAVYITASESAVTDALRELSDDLQRAGDMASGEGEQRGGQQAGGGISETLAETRALRRSLQRLAEGNASDGSPTSRGRDDLQRSTGIEVDDLEVGRDFDLQADQVSDDVLNLFRELRRQDIPMQELDDLRRLAAEVRAADFSGNPELLERESRHALGLVEQLEIALAGIEREDQRGVRTNNKVDIPEEHRDVVADYYRRLGQTSDETIQ